MFVRGSWFWVFLMVFGAFLVVLSDFVVCGVCM